MTDDPSEVSVPTSSQLIEILAESQRLGFLGRRPVDQVIAHARHYVDAIRVDAIDRAGLSPIGLSVLDLGAGGGLPGLVIAHDLPDASVTLLDRRQTRTDFLARSVRRLEWSDRVDVVTQDASRPSSVQRGAFDVAVARGFGPPATTLKIATHWVRSGGFIVISEPPDGNRWSSIDTASFGVDRRISPAQVALFAKL